MKARSPRRSLAVFIALLCTAAISAVAQQSPDPGLIADVVHKHLAASSSDNHAYRYTIRRTDHKGAVTRIAISTPTGTVSRTFLRQGKPLTAAEHAAEKARLADFIRSSSDQKKKTKSEASSRKFTQELCDAMPSAMLYTMRPGQPQLPQFPAPQLVIDYAPNPAFHPTTTAQDALRGLTGTLWIDARTHLIRRIEAHSIRDINFMLGLVAKVYTGASLETDTAEWAPGKLTYARTNIDASIRELLVRTQHFQSSEQDTDYLQLKDGLTLPEAAQLLIDLPDNSIH